MVRVVSEGEGAVVTKARVRTAVLVVVAALVGRQLVAWAFALEHQAVEKSVVVGGEKRTYLLFIPPEPKGEAAPVANPPAKPAPRPLVLALHGGGGNGRQMERYSRLNDVAVRHGFLVAYPDALEANWNDGRGSEAIASQKKNVDDVLFIRKLVDAVSETAPVDRGRVFATGISNGAFMSHRLAAEASDLVAAVAPVVGGMAPAIAEKFNPEHPVSLLVIQGDSDPLVPFAGGDVTAFGRARGKLIPTEDALGKYLARGHVAGEPKIVQQDSDPADGTSVEIRTWPDGEGGVKTAFRLIKNGGHTWPGRPLYLPQAMIGKASQEFSASDVVWEFFASCPPRAAKAPPADSP